MHVCSHTLNAICLLHNNATELQSQPSQKCYNKQTKFFLNRKTFLNLIHCCQTNSNLFFFENWQRTGGWEDALALFGKKQTLNHVMNVKTDTLTLL